MIGSLFTFIKGKTKIIVGVIVVVLATLLMYYSYNYGQVKEKNESLNLQYAELVSNQIQLKNRAEEQQKNLSELRNNNQEILSNYHRAIEDIDKLKQMKPEEIRTNKVEVQKKLNLNYSDLQNRFSCITGDTSKCSRK